MLNCAIQVGATSPARPITNQELLAAEAMPTQVDIAEVKAREQFERFIGGVDLTELRGSRRAIAGGPGLLGALVRRQGDGDG
jgi:hypothetical protein